MPKRKDLKRLVRGRMHKTGESYTTARMRIVGRRASSRRSEAELAGMSDEAVRAKTGRTWREWVRELDAVEAVKLSHGDIARHVAASYELSSWWTQTVTVGYERIRGLREIGQRRDGGFEAHKSKTFAVPVSRLYRAVRFKRARQRWLPDIDPVVRAVTAEQSMRASWPDGTSVQFQFVAKGLRKSQVVIQHVGLNSREDVDRKKAYWTERLSALASIL
jgi:hypothetical protein